MVDEILIYEKAGEKAVLKYKILRGQEDLGSMFCYASSSVCVWLGYPFEILLWSLPTLLNSEYKEGNRLEVPSSSLEDLDEKMVSGQLFKENKLLEIEMMEKYREEFPEGYQKHFGALVAEKS